ncbi:transaldolase, putative [Deinococcus geothermalis DSM 11300]|uniref:Probable transaldolase n=1 Tax=Deinococcus geothermalis (strain DSM 11300 / CIP 105573 / AG-3a) TaxID=319795 RepID=Q1IZD4_DEIGD|nr:MULTISPECIES: fructose-6-phosphate aldolase [Deinococcus]ABF45400.1 transaldolase, putative [Deinococcus geothermalis DSM 11300]MBI0445854.1 fructose-6-phosphate aldolase [Deinococcus sp. DB0503]
MQFFIDTAIIDEVREINRWGVLSGVTTNPSLVAASGRDFKEVIQELAALVGGAISAEATALDAEGMIKEGREFASWSEHVVVKLPLTPAGLQACQALTSEGIRTNITLCFSVPQALLAARAGASYISPFAGRVDDIGWDGIELVRQIKEAYVLGDIPTKVLAASIRHPQHVVQAALAGADVATVPYKVFTQMIKHPLTQAGLDAFLQDWARRAGASPETPSSEAGSNPQQGGVTAQGEPVQGGQRQ